MTSSGEPDEFLDYLLRCAVSAPAAETSATAGRMVARLLIAGAVEGSDGLITPYLVPVPAEDATFAVRTYRRGVAVSTTVRDGLRADAALKMAERSAHNSDEIVEVVSRTTWGLERRVLVRDTTSDLEFRFAGPDTLVGAPADCVAAGAAWQSRLSAWRALAPSPGTDARLTLESPPAPAVAMAPSGHSPTATALREAIGDLVVEVDLGQVEQLIRRALADDRQELAEPLAQRLSARLIESDALPSAESLARAIAEALGVAPGVFDAKTLADDIGALLVKSLPRNGSGDPGVARPPDSPPVGMEQLQLRLDGIQDQLRKSAALLERMGDYMQTGFRSAIMAERLATSADQEVQHLVRRIDEQLSVLAAGSAGGLVSDASDDVARLTRKLRDSVAQFDRAVVRMNQMFERFDGSPVKPRALLAPSPVTRSPGPSGPTAPR